MPSQFARLTADQVKALPREKTLFLFAVAPLEDHGPHLPLGTDLLEASRLCELMGERIERDLTGWSVVIMPAVPLGRDSFTQSVAIKVRPHVLRDWLVDATRALIKEGFFYFACFSGHGGPKQVTAVEEAGQCIYRSTRFIRLYRHYFGGVGNKPLPIFVSLSSSQVTAQQVQESPLFLDIKEHGGRRDTSVMMAIDPSQVGPAQPTLSERAWSSPSHYGRLRHRLSKQISGYWGKPADATAAWGHATLASIVDEVFPKLKAVLEGSNPELLFRSWYSILPFHRTFFKAWLLAMALFFMMLAWVWMNLALLLAP